jgi:hypothetical protein
MLGCSETEPTWYISHYLNSYINQGFWEEVDGMRIGRGNGSTRRNPATLSTTNPTYPDLSLNPEGRSVKPATNCLICGTAINEVYSLLHLCFSFVA